MAARRLILVMVVLLGVSTAIAMITPQPESTDSTPAESATGTSGATGASGETGDPEAGGSSGASENSGAGGTPGASKSPDRAAQTGAAAGGGAAAGAAESPGSKAAEGVGGGPNTPGLPVTVAATGAAKVINASPGDRVILVVKATGTAEIEIPRLGRVETATRYAPARFDLVLPPKPGSYEVRDLGSTRVRATIDTRSDPA